MNTKKITSVALMVIAAIAISGTALIESHAQQTVIDNTIQLTVDHGNEPAIGHEKAKWPGRHDVLAFVSQSGSPISDATLQVDKWFFKNVSGYNTATTLNDADDVSLNNTMTLKSGTPNLYTNPQFIEDGVYIYRIHGIANGTAVDATIGCVDPGMTNSTKFNDFDTNVGGTISCPVSVESLEFP